jgi:hypothetical protein
LLNDETLTSAQRNYIWSVIEFIDWGIWNTHHFSLHLLHAHSETIPPPQYSEPIEIVPYDDGLLGYEKPVFDFLGCAQAVNG